jgi:hypothetical protein
MHRAIAVWLTERPWRAGVASAIAGALAPLMLPLTPVFAAAIGVLIALRFDARRAIAVAVASALAAGVLVLAADSTTRSIAITAWMTAMLLAPTLLALLLRRTGSLNLCFQTAVLVMALAVVVIHLALPDPVAVWYEPLNAVIDAMLEAGVPLQGDRALLVAAWARTMWGALVAITLGVALCALFLGRWWATLLIAPGSFGDEYRRLRLGVVLGVATTGLFVLTFIVDMPLVGALAWVAFTALSFQGLAAAHRSIASGGFNRGWLAAIYVLLVVPISTAITVVALGVWGFADNWLRPRAKSV